MALIRETYRKMRYPARKYGECKSCGKRIKRQRTFWHTVNPFNKNADGFPKSPSEVWQDVKAEGLAWEKERLDDQCQACKAA